MMNMVQKKTFNKDIVITIRMMTLILMMSLECSLEVAYLMIIPEDMSTEGITTTSSMLEQLVTRILQLHC